MSSTCCDNSGPSVCLFVTDFSHHLLLYVSIYNSLEICLSLFAVYRPQFLWLLIFLPCVILSHDFKVIQIHNVHVLSAGILSSGLRFVILSFFFPVTLYNILAVVLLHASHHMPVPFQFFLCGLFQHLFRYLCQSYCSLVYDTQLYGLNTCEVSFDPL